MKKKTSKKEKKSKPSTEVDFKKQLEDMLATEIVAKMASLEKEIENHFVVTLKIKKEVYQAAVSCLLSGLSKFVPNIVVESMNAAVRHAIVLSAANRVREMSSKKQPVKKESKKQKPAADQPYIKEPVKAKNYTKAKPAKKTC